MPIYEYQCTKNGHIFEVFHKITEEGPQKCTVCGSKVKRLISPSTFHLKGTGWYKTDYGSGNSSAQKPKKDIEKKPKTDTKKAA
jgi:putative FmdB family regulatory protein